MSDGDPDPPPAPTTPVLRASDADRERTADVLRAAAGEGRLTFEELDERLHAAYAAVTRHDLEGLVTDVVVPDDHRDHLTAPSARRGRVPVLRGEGGSRWLLAIMSGLERSGRWRLARRCQVINLMGGSELDLNDVEFAEDEVQLTVWSVMGGGEVRVPDHMNVRVSDLALMGGNSVKLGEGEPDPGGPVLHLRLISIMGGTDVARGRKLTREERREQRRDRRHEREQRHLDRHFGRPLDPRHDDDRDRRDR
jgi:hypothetical protein